MLRELLRYGLRNLRERKLRSLLTGLGIVISVAAIVALLSISSSLQLAIESQFAKMGANRIFVMVPGGQPGTRAGLTEKDVEVLERFAEFEYVTPYLMESSAEVVHANEEQFLMVIGWPDDDVEQRVADYDFKFQAGNFFREGQSKAIVVGSLVAAEDEIFRKEVRLHNRLEINGEKFEVVGILESVGNAEDDKHVYMPLDTARALFNKPTEVSFIDATLKPGQDVDAVAEKVKRQLERSRGDEHFEVLTPAQVLKFLSTILGIVQGILVSIAAISLVVGAVGIMNSMYTAVLERTQEIGVMKAIGATNKSILLLFMLEAGILGFVGGLFGVFFGNLLSYGVSKAAQAGGFGIMQYHFQSWIVIVGLVFATLVGMLSGYLPAKRAERMAPVEALRYGK